MHGRGLIVGPMQSLMGEGVGKLKLAPVLICKVRLGSSASGALHASSLTAS